MLNVITKRQLTWCLRNNFDHGDFSRFLVDFMIHENTWEIIGMLLNVNVQWE